MLSRMFENFEKSEDPAKSSLMPSVKDENGCFLIDRSPKYFEPMWDIIFVALMVSGLLLIMIIIFVHLFFQLELLKNRKIGKK